MRPQRPSDGTNVPQPQQQIVGFHVEGQSPSPSPSSILQDSLRTISSGSPTPVIIPPQFQRENSLPRSDSTASRSLAPEFSASTAGKPQNILRTTSGDRKPDLTAIQSAGTTPAAGTSLPPPGPAQQAASSQAKQQQQAEATQQGEQGAQQTAAAAAAAAASGGDAQTSSSTSSSTPAPAAGQQKQQQPPPPAAKQQQQQTPPQQGAAATTAATGAAAAAGSAGGAGGAGVSATAAPKGSGAPPPGHKPPPKVPKPTTRAERRALQEAQKAAKAAAKAGGAGGGGGGAGGAGSSSSGGAGVGKGGGGGGGGGAGGGDAGGRPPRAPGGPSAAGGRGASGGDAAAAAGSGSLSRGGSGAMGAAGGSGGAGGLSTSGSTSGGRAGRAAASASALHSTELFAHLQQYRPVSVEAVLSGSRDSSSVHPAVLALGLRYGDGSITGSTARCVALVHALCQVIADYHTPPGKSLQRDLMATINAAVDFLVRCRPLSVSMGNAIKTLKLYISKTDPAAPEAEAKSSLLALMREWLQEKVAMADKVLVEHAVTKVYDGDVILTYAYSQVVLEVLLSAAAAGRRFHVIVLDSRPELEGRQMLRRLLQADIPCSYVLLSGLSYIMREVSKVILGASAVLSNGTVLSRAGSAAVAMTAHASSKPVLVCCEAFKFHERVQLDSITHNELGDPDMLAHLPPYAPGATGAIDPVKGSPSKVLKGWRDSPRLALLNLKYDAMPAEYVTMVVTEFGMIPPSSVPVILREFSQSAQLEY